MDINGHLHKEAVLLFTLISLSIICCLSEVSLVSVLETALDDSAYANITVLTEATPLPFDKTLNRFTRKCRVVHL